MSLTRADLSNQIQKSTSFPGVLVSDNANEAYWLASPSGGAVDKILFYDHSGVVINYLTVGSGLSITGTVLDTVAGGPAYNIVQEEGVNINIANTTLNFVGSGITAADATGGVTSVTLDSTLNALAGFNSNGYLVQTSTDTFTARTLTGTSGRLTVTNGDGSVGNPVFNVDPNFASTNLFDTSNIMLLDNSQTVTGVKTFDVNIILNGTPTIGSHGVNKDYVDGLVAGFTNTRVDLATTANIALSGEQTIDTILTSSSDVLVKDQTLPEQNGIYCVDDKTEILTKEGYKFYNELKENDIVLTFNMDTGKSEWQPVKAVHIFEDKEYDMYFMEHESHSSLSTLNHRWPVKNRNREITSLERLRNEKGQYINDKPDSTEFYRIKESAQLSSEDYIIRAAKLTFFPEIKTYQDELVELVAWFFTEGHIRINKSGTISNTVRISQSAKVNSQKVARIINCLTVLFGEQVESLKGKGYKIPLWSSRPARNGMIIFDLNTGAGKILTSIAPNRVINTEFIDNLTEDQLNLFVETAIDADGSRPDGKESIFTQKCRNRLHSFIYASHLLGRPFTIHNRKRDDCLQVDFVKSRYSQPHEVKAEVVKYNGIVWCPETDNTTWFARRNDTYYFTGNTTAAGAWTRRADMNAAGEVQGTFVLIGDGTQEGQLWLTVSEVATLGTDPIVFSEFSPGTIDGVGAADRIAVWSDTDTLGSDANFKYASSQMVIGDTAYATATVLTTKGSTTNNSAWGLAHLDSAGVTQFKVSNTGVLTLGTTTTAVINTATSTFNNASGYTILTSAGSLSLGATTSVVLQGGGTSSTAPSVLANITRSDLTSNQFNTSISGTFNPSGAGTNTYTDLLVAPTINQTTHTGITYSQRIAPTLTSVGSGGHVALSITATSQTALHTTAGNVKFDIPSAADNDTFYRVATTGVLGRVANGTTGQVYIATTGAAPSWGAVPTVVSEAYLEGSSSTTVDLDSGSSVKDVDGNNIAFTIPTDTKKFHVYRGGIHQSMSGTLTTRDYSVNTTTHVITFAVALTTDEIVKFVKFE